MHCYHLKRSSQELMTIQSGFFRSYPGVHTWSNSADYFRPYLDLYSRIENAEHLGIKLSNTHTNFLLQSFAS